MRPGKIREAAVTYLPLGHCHNPYSRIGRAIGAGSQQPTTFRGPWETHAFPTLLSNASPGRRRNHLGTSRCESMTLKSTTSERLESDRQIGEVCQDCVLSASRDPT